MKKKCICDIIDGKVIYNGKNGDKFYISKDGKIIYIDRNGTHWTPECIDDIFQMIHCYNSFLDSITYYRRQRIDGKDLYHPKM